MTRFRSQMQKIEARKRRAEMSPAEQVLWSQLRAHRFMGLSIRRQAPIGSYIAGFMIPSLRILIEAGDGLSDGDVQNRDRWLVDQGYRVLRFRDEDVIHRTGAVLQRLAREVEDV